MCIHMADSKQHPITEEQMRQEKKRTGPESGKAGRVHQKGGAPTSNKATGGKSAR